MSNSTLLRSADYQELLAVVGELGELAAAGSAKAAIDHLLVRVGERLAAGSSIILLDYPQGTAHNSQPPPWQIGHLVCQWAG